MFGFKSKKRIRVKLPNEVRVIAVGDIHGQIGRLTEVMDKVEAYREKYPVSNDHIIFLGDYTDRGPHSAEVVGYLSEREIRARESSHTEIFLKGNHEELLLEAIEEGAGRRFDLWWRNGGKQSIQSYANFSDNTLDTNAERWEACQSFRDSFPSAHQTFYTKLKTHYQVGPLVFVHAGLRMEESLETQNESDLFWIRNPFLNWKGDPKKYLVVHGHTITPGFRPEILSHRIGIDTGSYRKKGCITAAIFQDDRVQFLSSSARNKIEPGPFS